MTDEKMITFECNACFKAPKLEAKDFPSELLVMPNTPPMSSSGRRLRYVGPNCMWFEDEREVVR